MREPNVPNFRFKGDVLCASRAEGRVYWICRLHVLVPVVAATRIALSRFKTTHFVRCAVKGEVIEKLPVSSENVELTGVTTRKKVDNV